MDINYREIAERAVAYAAQSKIQLDYSSEGFKKGEDGAKTLWNIAVHFGIYLRETPRRRLSHLFLCGT